MNKAMGVSLSTIVISFALKVITKASGYYVIRKINESTGVSAADRQELQPAIDLIKGSIIAIIIGHGLTGLAFIMELVTGSDQLMIFFISVLILISFVTGILLSIASTIINNMGLADKSIYTLSVVATLGAFTSIASLVIGLIFRIRGDEKRIPSKFETFANYPPPHPRP